MYLQALTEHQIHLFGGILVLAIIVFGMIGVLTYLDNRGNKTDSSRPKKSVRQPRFDKKSSKKKARKK